MDPAGNMAAARGWGGQKGNGELLLHGHQVPALQDVLELDCGDGCTDYTFKNGEGGGHLGSYVL